MGAERLLWVGRTLCISSILYCLLLTLQVIGTRPGTLQEPSGLPEKERFSREISELLVCVGKCQPIEVLGEPGTVEIEASLQ